MRNKKILNDIFNFIEVVIDFNDKLYKRAIKKRYDQFRKKAKIFFELAIKY